MAGRGRGKRGNPWNRPSGPSVATHSVVPSVIPKPSAKPLPEVALSRNYSSSEDEDDDNNCGKILDNVLQSYSTFAGSSADLGRTRLFLEEIFQSGSATCLICISSVGKNDAIWSCGLCFCFFHLNCLQRWAQESIAHQKRALEEQPLNTTPDFNWSCPKCRHSYAESEIPVRYVCFCGKEEDPPKYNGWNIPHSCGENCNHELKPDCGHKCILLCHPGPCPPCPRQVSASCQCGCQPERTVRCSAKVWSCGQPCRKVLPCSGPSLREPSSVGRGRGKLFKELDVHKGQVGGDSEVHLCMEICHVGPCPPCPKESNQPCDCGRSTTVRPCSSSNWKCDKVCGKTLDCGQHKCSVVCHNSKSGCEPCPRRLPRHCACGKATFPGLTCGPGIGDDKSSEPVPTCGDTCGRMLSCAVHTCARRCHRDDCGACLQMRVQTCRCGQYSKELPCQKEFLCENKCRRTRNCLRHPCSRKCCDGRCPPCDKICSRTLSCGQHRCQAPCHRGPCYPCPLMVAISCPCQATSVKVPCGQERRIKGDAKRGRGVVVKCRKPCKRPSECQHPRKPHSCHSGDCPPCREMCNIVRKEGCSHACTAICHTSVWVKEDVGPKKKPEGPWEKPPEPKMVKKCLPCPPCTAGVEVDCLGGHERSSQPCHSAAPYSCGRECGRVLPCESHFCTFPCHHVKGSSTLQDSSISGHSPAGRNCEQCNHPCLKTRPYGCPHPCGTQCCHRGECPPCKQTVKQKCHCGLTPSIFIECRRWTAALREDNITDKENSPGKVGSNVEVLLSCSNQCPKLLSCGHRCEAICHSGTCPADSQSEEVATGKNAGCVQKVRVTCPCGRIKQRRICKDVAPSDHNVQAKDGKGPKTLVLLKCDEECKLRVDEESRAREASLERKRAEEERRNAEELEKYKLKMEGKRGRGRRRREFEESGDEGKWWTSYWMVSIIVLFCAAVVGVILFLKMGD
ncbi:NF-X1-type zinc finger protein NFXL1-like [Ischnura elegans]|uniref:NF-X1-type zinc finger protein NFXL1-like n=1 Tax=Ischnura elegans TaxID=197161 RepID=UPI001ED8A6B7|nr:NF-X1-type zinc finger protein NFXL1-like [Ischnura elegans]